MAGSTGDAATHRPLTRWMEGQVPCRPAFSEPGSTTRHKGCLSAEDCWCRPTPQRLTFRFDQEGKAMTNPDRIARLLVEWERRSAHGESVSAVEVCRDCPD